MTSKPPFGGEVVRLGDVCEIVLGQSPSSDSYNADGKGLPFYQGNADFGKEHPTPKVWCDAPKKTAQEGDILLSVRAPIGAVNTADESCCIGRGVAAIRPNSAKVSSGYLKQQLLARRVLLESMGTGSTFKAVGKKILAEFPVALYPLAEQEGIDRKLSAVQSRIDAEDQILTKLNSLVKSRFAEMFGDPVDGSRWPRRKLGDIYSVKSSKRIYAREQTKDGVPFYRLADINSLIDISVADSGLYISEDRYGELLANGQVPVAGDILVTARGTLGRCYVIGPDDRFYFQDGMITWLSQTNESPLPIYLTSVFDDVHFIDYLRANCSGTTVKYLSIADLAKVTVPLPPLALQREFADFAAAVDKLRVDAQAQKEKLQTLYDSLAQNYFAI